MWSHHKATRKPKEYGAQYVDITINRILVRAMVDMGVEDNIMTKTEVKRLALCYYPTNVQLRTVNALATPLNGVTHGVSITLGKYQGKTNFTISPLNLFNIILMQEFF